MELTEGRYNTAIKDAGKINDVLIKNAKVREIESYKVYVDINSLITSIKVSSNKKDGINDKEKLYHLINSLNDNDPKKAQYLEIADSLKVGKSLNIESGFYEEFSGKLTYYVYIPPDATTNMPLLLWLHGDNPRVEWIKNNKIATTAYNAGYPIIMVQPYGGSDFGHENNPGWAEGGLLPSVKEIVDLVCEKYECDKDNINIGGHSRGAIGTWRMVSMYPNYFHAAAPVSCCAYSGFVPSSFTGVKVWAWRGTGKGEGFDNDDRYSCMGENMKAIEKYAKEKRYTIQENTSHGEATDKLQVSEEFVRFMFTD